MRVVWTADDNASAVRGLLATRGFSTIEASLPADTEWRLQRRLPVVIDASGAFVSEAFQFFFDVGVIRGSTRSMRTLETYAECLCNWLSYAERAQAPWRQPSSAILAAYRDDLLGTSSDSVHRSRALARRTVNLRMTVAIEFYKFLADLPDVEPGVRRVISRRLPQLRRLRVRVDRRRPRALGDAHCRLLCERLRGVHRLMFQWALCTGLRTSSLVSVQLVDFLSLLRTRSFPRLLKVRAKGGKVVTVHVPQPLLQATLRYIEIERVLSNDRARCPATTLFLNSRGGALTGKTYYRAFRRAREALRVAACPHQARSTFATRVRDKLEELARSGAQLDVVKVVQSLLAHADAKTTEQYLASIDIPSIDILAVLDQLSDTTFRAAGST